MNNKLFHNNGKLSATDIANELLKHSVYITDSQSEAIYRYDGSCYVKIDDNLLRKKIMQLCNFETSKHQRTEILDILKNKTSLCFKNLSQYNNCLNIKNGIFDVSKNKLLPRTSNDYFFYVVETDYNPSATCPGWIKFLDQIFAGDTHLIEIIQNMFGYCLLSGNFLHVSFIFVGTGQNGKSTVMSVLRELLNKDNISSLSMTDISDRFKLITLQNKLANICDESPSKKQVDLDVFKNLVAGGIVTAEEKHKPATQFQNNAKLIFSCNSTPLMNDPTEAFNRRLVIVPFDYHVKEEEKDVYLLDKLINELPGIFNWALAGAKNVLLKNNPKGLFYSEKGEEAKKKFIRETDNVKAFLDDECDFSNPQVTTSSTTLYDAYKKYCTDNGYTACSSGQFGIRLKNYYPNVEKIRKSTGTRARCYKGISIKELWDLS